MAVLAQLIDDVVANKFKLSKPSLTIGRHPDSDIQIDDASVSGRHAIIEMEKSKYLDNTIEVFVKDIGSTNGTFVNGSKVTDRQRLVNNDIVRIAWNEFKYMDDSQNTLESTAHILQGQ